MIRDRITYVGHSTLLIEMNGVRLLTDPLLRRRVMHLQRSGAPIQNEWHDQIDAVLISHPHWDHLDLPSLKRVGRDTRIIVPSGSSKLLRRSGFRHIEEVVVGDQVKIGEVEVTATFADHSGHRPPFGPHTDCLGYLMEGDSSVYFAGDTDMFPEMALIGRDLDVALLPVWGWGPTLGSGHMTPKRAAQSLGMLQPRLAIPIHWGTFSPVGMGWFAPKFLSVPPQLFTDHAERLAPAVRVAVLKPGEGIDVG